jgi:nucleotide-binding universal stress UspA family protein
MTVSHILVPYDGTDKSDHAFDEALKITKKYSCTLSVVTCFHQSYKRMFGYVDYILDEKSISSKIKKLKEKAKIENVSFSDYLIDSPQIVGVLLAFADENNVDMIIMGSQKRQGFKKLLQGSISEEIQKHAKCIVKII